MGALRCLTNKSGPLKELINECFAKKPNVRMGILKRSMIGETYEGTGKTTGYILNKKGIDVICVDYVSSQGFKLTNGWTIIGPAVLFPHTLFSWQIKDLQDINEDTLSLFSLIRPKLDCLFLGYGSRKIITYTRVKELLHLCNVLKINVELLPTEDAAATFNFCSLDKRFVAAALIPPADITLGHDMELITDK